MPDISVFTEAQKQALLAAMKQSITEHLPGRHPIVFFWENQRHAQTSEVQEPWHEPLEGRTADPAAPAITLTYERPSAAMSPRDG
jgi:hypothetical protein